MAMMGKASEKGIEEVSKIVLAPHFHREDNPSKKVNTPSAYPYLIQRLAPALASRIYWDATALCTQSNQTD